MRERANDPGCEGCHAPLAALTDPAELAVDEGVTCDVCHAIKDVEGSEARPRAVYALAESRKYGPYCDAPDNYFHRMGCAPVHREARVCGACHALSMPLPSGESLPILTEYDEWRASSFSTSGTSCQDCHMPMETTHAATGTERKVAVGHHGFMGPSDELLRKALAIVASAKDEGDKLVVTVTLKNEAAGHAVPSGMPGRQVVMRARALDEEGQTQAQGERALGRVLVDGEGREAPFYAARAERADDRILPGLSRTITIALDAPRAGSLSVEVAWRSTSPAIAAATGVAAEERTMAKLEMKLGARRSGGGRAIAPKTVAVRP